MRTWAVVWIGLVLLACGGKQAKGLNPDLVGSWRSTFKVGHFASDVYMVLHGDGTYEYSTRTESKHPNTTTQRTPVVRGTWKAEGEKLYHTRPGATGWIESGTYRLSGRQTMMIQPPGGMAMLWVRTN